MKKFLIILLMFFAANVFAAPVDINSADAKTISESLKGIGPKKAEAIVQYRKAHGSFKSADDLDNVKGISKKMVDKLRNDILLEGGAASAPATMPAAAVPEAKEAGSAKPAEPNASTNPKK